MQSHRYGSTYYYVLLSVLESTAQNLSIWQWCEQVLDARASSAKAQLLLKNFAERKRQKQAQRQGLVILEASYGDIRACQQGTTSSVNDNGVQPEDDDSDLPPPYLDVTIPLQFLVDDSSQLQVWFSHTHLLYFLPYHYMLLLIFLQTSFL
jgi:hypothetical protein